MLKICLGFWKFEPRYAYKLYAYKKNMYVEFIFLEPSYLTVFGLKIPIISKLDELFQRFLQTMYVPMVLGIWQTLHCFAPSNTPPFTCKQMTKVGYSADYDKPPITLKIY